MADQRYSFSSFTYDVFLSYKDDDTGHLLKALRGSGILHTYIEDKELPKGDEITMTIVKAIEESKIAIIVFSENYATSSFCLDVLASILENFQGNPRFIVPVYYGVDPSHVQRQRGTYGEALEMHEEKLKDNNQKVLKWRNALHQVANLSGLHFRHGDEYEFQFIEKIVEEVSRKINRAPLHVADHPVGLESRLKEVWSLLELESNGVLMVGIHGVGGIGKTTLARAVYNLIAHLFEGLCFLDGVRESSNIHGLVHLQNMLLSEMIGLKDIQLGNPSKGASSIIKHSLHRKKVLLILDDVDTLEQLDALVGGSDWFGPGSRVIITTRDRHLLAFHGVERRYEVQELNQRDALELLSYKVFRQGIVDPNYTELLNRVVTYASGLPLALEVIGSSLFGKTVDQWRHALDRFEQILPNNIQKILKVSFDGLELEEKRAFLDIACCFKGYELVDVQDILCAHYGHDMKYHIEVLIDKSLISISLDGKVTPRPLVEGMGREIIRRESPAEPGKRSRLWFHEDVLHILKNNTGTSNIEIIHLDSPLIEDGEAIEWDGEAFKKTENLRTLIIKKCHFSKAPKYLPNSLRVLEWWRYPSQELPSNFDPKQLDIFKLPSMAFMSPKLADLLKAPDIVPQVSQTSQRVAQVMSSTSPSVFQAEYLMWRLVGLVSSTVGLACYALSPSFKCLIGGWNSFKLFLYGVFCLVIYTTILSAKRSSLFKWHPRFVKFVVLMLLSVYSSFYDKCLGGKPEMLSLVSNAAFALVSLSLSKLIKFGFEKGIFSYFLGCLAVQLFTIDWKLIFVVIFFGFPLFHMHSSSDNQPEVDHDHGDQVNDSRPEVGSGGQHVLDIIHT